MGNQHGNFLAVIDVGSAKTCALVAEITDNGCGIAGMVSRVTGHTQGVIVDLEKAVSSIQRAVRRPRTWRVRRLSTRWLGVAGSHVRGMNTHGGITFGTPPREIAKEEIRLAVDKARAIPLPADRRSCTFFPGVHSG